jgi:hypothetical protein
MAHEALRQIAESSTWRSRTDSSSQGENGREIDIKVPYFFHSSMLDLFKAQLEKL